MMGRKILFTGIAMLLVFMFAYPVAAQEKPVKLIIKYKDLGDDVQLERSVLAHGGAIGWSWPGLRASAVTVPEKARHLLEKLPFIERVEEDAEVHALGRVDPEVKEKGSVLPLAQALPWGVDRIDAERVWSTTQGAGVKVAVLDTGIDYTHPDLDGNVKGGISLVGWRSSTSKIQWKDRNGHGTHCAGIIAAENNAEGVVGVAPKASLYAVKVLNDQGSGYISDVIEGIQWSVKNQMKVVSMSLGSSTHVQSLQDACDDAYGKGLLIVAAAGNTGAGYKSYPAYYASVISVGATDTTDLAPAWSNSNDDLELAAPGVNVLSTYPNNRYATASGTSMACPHVSGTAALVWAKNPSMTNAGLRTVLTGTADDLGTGGWDPVYGWGLVDAEEASSSFN